MSSRNCIVGFRVRSSRWQELERADELSALAPVPDGRPADRLERTIRQLELQPEAGSSRLAFDLNVPGVESFRAEAFPHLIFYLVRSDHPGTRAATANIAIGEVTLTTRCAAPADAARHNWVFRLLPSVVGGSPSTANWVAE